MNNDEIRLIQNDAGEIQKDRRTLKGSMKTMHVNKIDIQEQLP